MVRLVEAAMASGVKITKNILQDEVSLNNRFLYSEFATESARGIIRFGPIVVDENMIIPAITKNGSSQFPDR